MRTIAEIFAIRDAADVVAIVGETVALTSRGRSHYGACPWCGGALAVNGPRGFFHCFGCKESGSAFDWVMRSRGVSFHEAVDIVAARGAKS